MKNQQARINKKSLWAGVFLTAVASGLPAVTSAQEYQADIRAGIGSIDVEGGDNAMQYMLGGTAYFAPVETTNKPLAEAAFLGKASNLNAGISYLNTDISNFTATEIGAEWYIPNSMVYLAGQYTRLSGDILEGDAWSVSAGITPIEGFLVSTSYIKDSDYEPNIDAKYVLLLNEGRALNMHGSLQVGDDVTYYTAGMDYYFNANTSVGFEYEDSTGDEGDIFDSYTVNGKHFFTEKAYVGAFYTGTDYTDTVGLDIGMRF